MTTTTKSEPLTMELAERLIANLWGHNDYKVYRSFGSLVEGAARAKRSRLGEPDEDRLYIINDGRIVSIC
jgi:hypothetical protein